MPANTYVYYVRTQSINARSPANRPAVECSLPILSYPNCQTTITAKRLHKKLSIKVPANQPPFTYERTDNLAQRRSFQQRVAGPAGP